jgi:hypothetical protein
MKSPKKTLLAFCLLLAGFAISQKAAAQNATLTVRLTSALVLTVNQTNPTLIFASASDYSTGVSVTYNNALTVTSTTAYTVKVRAAGDLVNGANSIPVANVKVAPTGNTGVGTTATVALSTTDQNIITTAPAAILKNINLTFSTDANNAAFIGHPAGDYVTTITFTATAG